MTFNDGTTAEIDVPVKVVDNRTDAEKNNPDVTTSVTVTQGEDVNPEDLVKNREQLPDDITIDWIVAPNTDQVARNNHHNHGTSKRRTSNTGQGWSYRNNG